MSAALDIGGYYGKNALLHWRVSTSFMKLRDILPNKTTALVQWYELLKKSHSYVETPSVDDKLAPLLSPLTTEERGRMRYMKGYKVKNQKWVNKLGFRWGTSIDLYLNLLPKKIRVEVVIVLKQLRLIELTSSEDVNSILKDMSILMKKHGTLLSNNWKYYVAWDTFGGYAPLLDIMEQVDTIKFWVSGNAKHTFLGDEKKFLEHINYYSYQFLNLGPNVQRANDEAQTIEEWSREPVNWARSGTSSNASKILYYAKGKTFKSRKSKWATALNLEAKEVEKLVREKRIHKLVMTNVAIQKREPSKIRAIITSDDQMYLKMSYVSHWLETALQNHPKTTLFYSAKQANQMWKGMSRACLVEDVKVPIDQTRFDHQPNRHMDKEVFAAIRQYITVNATPKIKDELLSVLWSIEYSMLKTPRFVTVKTSKGEIKIPSTKGLESGLRWTALWGTILNYAELLTAKDIVEEIGINNPIKDEVVQGDDDKVRAKNIAAAAAIVGAYKSMELELNLKKFFTDFGRDEFLRQVALWKGNRGDVSGYPARGILSLLWRNPVSKDPTAGLLRAREQLKGWNLMIGRGCDKLNVYNQMFKDITQANGISNDELAVLLRTPASLGGLGYWTNHTRKGLKLEIGIKRTEGKIVLETVKGLDWNISELKRVGMPVTKMEAVSFIIPNLELLHANKEIVRGEISEVDVIKRYYNESNGGKGVPLTPRVNEEIPKTLSGLALSKAKERKDWQWIEHYYIEEADRAISNKILKSGGRSIWLDWIENKLDFSAPVIPGWSETAVSVMFNELVQSYWTKVVSMHRFSRYAVKRAAVTCEHYVREKIRQEVVHIGG